MNGRSKVTIVSISMSLLLSTGLIWPEGKRDRYSLGGLHAEAAAVTYYKTTSNLNMRSGASTKKSIIMTIPKGKQVTYISKSGSWFKVKYGSKTGYVSSTYLKKVGAAASAPKEAATRTVYKTTSNLNMRSKATTAKGSRVLLTIPKGKEVTYISKSGNWYKVKYHSKTGYVSSKYIKKTTTPVTTAKSTKITSTTYQTTANLHMRSTASAKGKHVITIPKGKRVTATEKFGDWYKVTYSGKTGWVVKNYIKEYHAYSTTAATYYSTNKSAGIYENPNTKKKLSYTLPKDYLLTSTQKVVNSIGQTWYRITYNKKHYFIQSTAVVRKQATSINKTSYQLIQDTDLYSAAGTAHSKLSKIAKGTVITTSYRIGDWYQITHNGKKGYVMGKLLKAYKAPTITKPVEPEKQPEVQENKPADSENKTPAAEAKPDGQAITEAVFYVIVDRPFKLRSSDSTSSEALVDIPSHTAVKSAYKTKSGWYEVSYKGQTGYVSGHYLITKAEYDRYRELANKKDSYLTLDLRTESSVTAVQINQYIDDYVKRTGKPSVLANKGQAFINAGKQYGVNALYLAAHAVHESGYGTSVISLAKNNLFGFGAYDLAPFVGAMRFSTIEENIEYIAREIKATYLSSGNWKHKGPVLGYTIKNVNGARVDSLSKGMNFYYASDSSWGSKIESHMSRILAYRNEKAVGRKPITKSVTSPARPIGVDKLPTGTLAAANTPIKLYDAKDSTKAPAATIKKGETFYLLEKWNDNWFKIQYKGKSYFTNVIGLSSYHQFMKVYNLAHITTGSLNVRSGAGVQYDIVGKLSNYAYVELVLDKSKNPVEKNGWYQVKLPGGKNGWVSGSYIARDLTK